MDDSNGETCRSPLSEHQQMYNLACSFQPINTRTKKIKFIFNNK